MDMQSRLLGATGPAPHWANLGAWISADGLLQPSQPYNDAANRLAQLHATAVGLNERDSLLELGAGTGASLRLWANYGVRNIITIDQAVTELPAELEKLGVNHHGMQANFDAPWPALPLVGAVIAVDALYHARSLDSSLSNIAAQLAPQGRWALSTLQIDAELSRSQKTQLKAQLLACGIAWSGVWHQSFASIDSLTTELPSIFANAGLAVQRIDDLTESVFAGFALAIKHRKKHLSLSDKLHPAWWKLSLTARLCRSLVASGKLRYVLISGEKAT